MESIDAKIFAAITLGTLTLIEILKGFFKGWVSGKETQLALLIPILFVVIGKLAGWFSGTDWPTALMWAFAGSATSGVSHDKLLDPGKKMVSSILPKKPPTS